jgi:hypothetical protein
VQASDLIGAPAHLPPVSNPSLYASADDQPMWQNRLNSKAQRPLVPIDTVLTLGL